MVAESLSNSYVLVVGHLLLPDAMPALNAVHLLPQLVRNRARCHLLPAAGFFHSQINLELTNGLIEEV
jgi:hypothetical protein